MAAEQECLFAIADGIVTGAAPVEDANWLFEVDPDTTEVVRMPASAFGRFYNNPWPGREAALAILAQEADRESA